jgi:hypothetical protein
MMQSIYYNNIRVFYGVNGIVYWEYTLLTSDLMWFGKQLPKVSGTMLPPSSERKRILPCMQKLEIPSNVSYPSVDSQN